MCFIGCFWFSTNLYFCDGDIVWCTYWTSIVHSLFNYFISEGHSFRARSTKRRRVDVRYFTVSFIFLISRISFRELILWYCLVLLSYCIRNVNFNILFRFHTQIIICISFWIFGAVIILECFETSVMGSWEVLTLILTRWSECIREIFFFG